MAENNNQTLDYARSLNQEYENQNKNLDQQISNLKNINASWDKIAQLQAQRLQNIVKQSELMGTMTDDLRAYADISAQVNQKNADFIRLRENGLSTATEYMTDFLEKKKAQEKVEKRLNELQEEKKDLAQEQLQSQAKNVELGEEIKKKEEQIAKLRAAGATDASRTVQILQEQIMELEVAREIEVDIVKARKEKLDTYEKESDAINKIKKANDEAFENFKSGAFMKGIEKAGDFGRAATDAYGKVNAIASEMYKTTGGNIKLMDNIQANFEDGSILGMASMGIGFENIAEAMVNLNQKSGAFAVASSEVQKEVGMVATKLERLGVSAEASGELFDTLRLNFGYSASEFEDMADTFVGRASDIGMSVQQYTQDFQASYHVLGKYGTDSVNVFDKLARHARASGMSVQELASAMSDDNFGTFSGAAENASKLNFLLGSQLDTTQLLMADEAERLEMIKGAFSPAQFQNMDKFKKKAIAAAAGFSDVGAFEKAMRGDVEGLGDLAKSNQEKLDDAVVKSTSAQEAMSKAIENSKDQMVLAMGKMSEQLGVKGQTMYGSALAASTALQNFASILKMTSMITAAREGGGMFKTVAGNTGMSKAYGAFTAQRSSGASLLSSAKGSFGAAAKGATSVGKLAGFGGMLASGAMVAKDAFDVGSALYKGEDVKGEDVGGMIGGVIGGAVGIIGGPAGVALGAGIGNMLGESLGSLFDEDKEEKKKQDKKTDKLIELQEESNKINERTAKAQEKQEQWNQNKRNFAHVVSGIDSRKGIRGS